MGSSAVEHDDDETVEKSSTEQWNMEPDRPLVKRVNSMNLEVNSPKRGLVNQPKRHCFDDLDLFLVSRYKEVV